VPEFVTTTSQLATIGAHGGSETTNGSPFLVQGTWGAAARQYARPGHPRGPRLHPEPHPQRSQRPFARRSAQGHLRRPGAAVVGGRRRPLVHFTARGTSP
jgi:hypothetical protein